MNSQYFFLRIRAIVVALIWGVALTQHTNAAATPLPFDEGAYSYYANDTPIDKMLTEFCANFGLRLEMAPGIGTKLNGRLAAVSPSEFLNFITASAGLDWFYYAGTIFVSRVSDRDTKAHAIPRESIPGLKTALTDLKVLDDRFGWAALAEQGLVVVSGPQAYLDLIAKTIRTVQAAPNGQQMVIWKLRYANVEDRTVTIRDRIITVPGIKTMLQALGGGARLEQPAKNAAIADGTKAEAAKSAVTTGEKPLVATTVPTSSAANAADGAATRSSTSRPSLAGREVSIEAEVRLNAIVMRGPADLLANYQALVAALDVPAGLVEIEAMTIDVNKSRLEELGIDWSANSRNLSIGFGDSSAPAAPGVLSLGYRATAATVVANQAAALVARLRLLENTGDAYVVGKPSILTSDNLSALIDLSQTFYTKVTGERVANLTPVTVGVMLKVTPRIVTTDSGQTEIQLVIDIEDGTLIDRTGLDLPVVQRTSISTQATIREGQSLLIGGYDTESQQESLAKVPGASQLPGLGFLFQSTRLDKQRRKRMFLITPRIVAMGEAAPAAGTSTAIPPEMTTLLPLLRLDRHLQTEPGQRGQPASRR